MAGKANRDDIPSEPVGEPVNECGARLIRQRFRDGEPVGVKVWGAHCNGPHWRSEQGFTVGSKAQLQSLITDLITLRLQWPND